VKITGLQAGLGKHQGKLGAFLTDMGKVGTGLTDHERVLYNTPDMIGQIIEVECMELTDDGKFRHPRFVRLRFDK
jgi:ATP-dependent DNA ligase